MEREKKSKAKKKQNERKKKRCDDKHLFSAVKVNSFQHEVG